MTGRSVSIGLFLLSLALPAGVASAQSGLFSAGSGSASGSTYRVVGVIGSAVPVSGRSLIQRKEVLKGAATVNGPVGDIPEQFSLRGNYPNPFQVSTTLRYGLPEDAHVRLEIFDTLGRRVATVVDGHQEAGVHLPVFVPDGLASGVYVYRIQAGRQVASRFMMLVR